MKEERERERERESDVKDVYGKINMSIVNDNVVWGFWDTNMRVVGWREFVSIFSEL